MTYRTRNILIASALALLAIVFMMVYISRVRDDADLGKKLVSVLVATRDIGEGTTGSSLVTGGLAEKQVPQRLAGPGYVSTTDQVRGVIAGGETLAGEQVSTRRFGPLAAAGGRPPNHPTPRGG